MVDNPDNDKLKLLIMSLEARLGRFPTEEEVTEFIFGNEEERQVIWERGAEIAQRQDWERELMTESGD